MSDYFKRRDEQKASAIANHAIQHWPHDELLDLANQMREHIKDHGEKEFCLYDVDRLEWAFAEIELLQAQVERLQNRKEAA